MIEVKVFLEGGVIHDILVPEGVRVTVVDFDIEGVRSELLKENIDGEEYYETVWEADEYEATV